MVALYNTGTLRWHLSGFVLKLEFICIYLYLPEGALKQG